MSTSSEFQLIFEVVVSVSIGCSILEELNNQSQKSYAPNPFVCLLRKAENKVEQFRAVQSCFH